MCYFGRCSYELTELVLLPHSCDLFKCYSNRLHDFSFNIPRCYKDVYFNSFFANRARLWKYLTTESTVFLHVFHLFLLVFLVTPCLAVDA